MNRSRLTVENSVLYGLNQLLSSESADQVDRFSALPPELVHRILNSVSLADAARVGCVSERCRELHISNRFLNFPGGVEVMNSSDRVLVHRESNKIRSFSVNWVADYRDEERGAGLQSRYDADKSRFMGWIRTAVSFRVESLGVIYRPLMPRKDGWEIEVDDIEFPYYVFISESLKSLIVDMHCAILTNPSFSASSISNLVCLRLTNVHVEYDKWFCNWISFSCIFLKELLLKNVTGLQNITIESSSLESLGLEFTKDYSPPLRDRLKGPRLRTNPLRSAVRHPKSFPTESLHISTPKLKHLKWVGKMMGSLSMEELNCLDEVEISLCRLWYSCVVLDHFLSRICSFKVLVVDPPTVETLVRKGLLPALFHNVRCLRIRTLCTGIYDELVPALASLFKVLPNLNTLEISCVDRSISGGMNQFKYSRGYWELQSLDFISQLKEVSLQLHTGFNDIGLAWYILEHAQNLKKMIIVYSPKLPHHLGFITKLKRTRSNAIVVCEEIEEITDIHVSRPNTITN